MGFPRLAAFLCVFGIGAIAAQAQVWDNSGNGMLNGTYYFRQVVYVASDSDGDLSEALAIYGNITFSGNGTYSITNAIVSDSSNTTYGTDALSCWLANTQCSASAAAAVSGTYSIAASGYGFLSSPIASVTNGDSIYGLVSSNGILIGSSTETAYSYNDLFIAAPVGAATPSFSGTYAMAGYLPSGSPGTDADVFFQLNPSGGGNLGTVNVTGYVGGASTSSQSSANVKYSASGGAEVVTFPTSSTAAFYSGPEYLYFSPDGSFCFGGSPYGYDLLVGVRNDSSTFNSGVLYYDAGLDLDTSTLSSGYATADSFYGSFSSTNGYIIEADRLLSVANANAYVSSFGDTTSDTTYAQYTFGNGGTVRIGYGVGPYLGISVALQAPKAPGSSGQSVYIDPTSLQNTGSYAPFTSGVSAGELITLYGTNLAAQTVVAPSGAFPNTLGNVQLIVNGVAAPLYYVSPTQLSALIPWETTASVADIQLVNNSTPSNVISAFVNNTTVGMFTQLQGGAVPGLGYAAAVHNATGQLVTPSNPAQPGEYIAAFLTGLGTVYPTVSDGAVGPSNPLSASTYCLIPSATSCTITASLNGVSTPLVFVGLAPTLPALYQMDLQIPSTGLTPGDQTLQICGPDSCSAESLLSVGDGFAAAIAPKRHVGRTNTALTRPRLAR
jgi:uncharacterized protein (TIGR03437 family)